MGGEGSLIFNLAWFGYFVWRLIFMVYSTCWQLGLKNSSCFQAAKGGGKKIYSCKKSGFKRSCNTCVESFKLWTGCVVWLPLLSVSLSVCPPAAKWKGFTIFLGASPCSVEHESLLGTFQWGVNSELNAGIETENSCKLPVWGKISVCLLHCKCYKNVC